MLGSLRPVTVVACMLAYGAPNYLRAARRAIRALLRLSAFDVFVGVEHLSGMGDLGPRVHPMCVPALPATHGRAEPFLLKFAALEEIGRAHV